MHAFKMELYIFSNISVQVFTFDLYFFIFYRKIVHFLHLFWWCFLYTCSCIYFESSLQFVLSCLASLDYLLQPHSVQCSVHKLHDIFREQYLNAFILSILWIYQMTLDVFLIFGLLCRVLL